MKIKYFVHNDGFLSEGEVSFIRLFADFIFFVVFLSSKPLEVECYRISH